jgi:chorismate mutase
MLVNGNIQQKNVKSVVLCEAVKLRPDIVQDFGDIY